MQQESVWKGSLEVVVQVTQQVLHSFMDSLIHSPINGTGCLWEEFRIQQPVRKIRFLFSQNVEFEGRQVNMQLQYDVGRRRGGEVKGQIWELRVWKDECCQRQGKQGGSGNSQPTRHQDHERQQVLDHMWRWRREQNPSWFLSRTTCLATDRAASEYRFTGRHHSATLTWKLKRNSDCRQWWEIPFPIKWASNKIFVCLVNKKAEEAERGLSYLDLLLDNKKEMVAAVENDRKMGGKPNYNFREKSKQHYMQPPDFTKAGFKWFEKRKMWASTSEDVILTGQ